ncbi:hypothetical protein VE02_06640 [Pseudogymnoascus sp. 03VT05]|nr:hypothetical protein VE02_06640 [Pseudogymnoascus sp. 03VT05]
MTLPEGPRGNNTTGLPEKVEPTAACPSPRRSEAVDKLHKARKFVRFGINNFAAFEALLNT